MKSMNIKREKRKVRKAGPSIEILEVQEIISNLVQQFIHMKSQFQNLKVEISNLEKRISKLEKSKSENPNIENLKTQNSIFDPYTRGKLAKLL